LGQGREASYALASRIPRFDCHCRPKLEHLAYVQSQRVRMHDDRIDRRSGLIGAAKSIARARLGRSTEATGVARI